MQPAGVLGTVSLESETAAFKFTLFSKEGLRLFSLSFASFSSLLLDGDKVVLSLFLMLFAHRLGILLAGRLLDSAGSTFPVWFTVLLISWNGRFLEGFGTVLEDLQLAVFYVMNRKKGKH